MVKTKIEDTFNIKSEFSNVEIYGAEAVFNVSLADYEYELGYEEPYNKEEFFISGHTINSTADANGHPIIINDHRLSHLLLTDKHRVIAVCTDENDTYIYYECTNISGFLHMDDYWSFITQSPTLKSGDWLKIN